MTEEPSTNKRQFSREGCEAQATNATVISRPILSRLQEVPGFDFQIAVHQRRSHVLGEDV